MKYKLFNNYELRNTKYKSCQEKYISIVALLCKWVTNDVESKGLVTNRRMGDILKINKSSMQRYFQKLQEDGLITITGGSAKNTQTIINISKEDAKYWLDLNIHDFINKSISKSIIKNTATMENKEIKKLNSEIAELKIALGKQKRETRRLKDILTLPDRKVKIAKTQNKIKIKKIEDEIEQLISKFGINGFEKDKFEGYVYLITYDDVNYKIGKSNDIKKRLSAFNFPKELKLVHCIKSISYSELEKQLHDYFRTKKVKGEWFKLEPEDIDFIKMF